MVNHTGKQDQTKSYPVDLLIIREEEGDYSAIALNLPGAGSCGDTIDEAIEHAKEAVQAAIKSYEDDGVEIPWDSNWKDEVPSGAEFRRIVVNA